VCGGGGTRRILNANASANPSPNLTPLAEAVALRARRTWEAPFHVPGHKRGSVIPPPLHQLNLGPAMQADLTELEGLDVLSSPQPGGPIEQAQQMAASAWGARNTWFLVNGSTAGIHAAIMATCTCTCLDEDPRENAIIVARNAHVSTFHAMILAKCVPVYVRPETQYDLGHHLTPEALERGFQEALVRGLTPKAALVVSPTYFGVVSDIRSLVRVCEKYQATLIVDEAHGAHLDFLSPPHCLLSALRQGAHLVIQSTHKQLAAFTQGGMLHMGWNASSPDLHRRISRALSILQTTSPSYLILASLDAARADAQDPTSIRAAQEAADHIRTWFLLYSKSHLSLPFSLLQMVGDRPGHDPWRFTVLLQDQAQQLLTGWEAAAFLERKYSVVSECASRGSVVFAVGVGTSMSHAESLTTALTGLHDHLNTHLNTCLLASSNAKCVVPARLPDSKMPSVNVPFLTPWKAFVVSQDASELIDIECASERISAEMLCPYPPGIPIVYPGEVIKPDMVSELQSVLEGGGRVVGAEDSNLKRVRVLKLSSHVFGGKKEGIKVTWKVE
jgi:arginine decarboxylase